MMHHPFSAARLTAILALVLMLGNTTSVYAQQASTNSTTTPQNTTESIALTVGDILELLPSTSIQSPTYSWILTQDRTFMQAGRSDTFRYRFIQPGNYSLIAEVQSADQSTTINRIFTITAKARDRGDAGISDTPAVTDTGSTALTGIVKIDPPMDINQRVILGSNQQLIKLTPINPDVKPLSLDLDTAKDTDGDGNPSNDIDDKGTFFQLYADPLYVWFTDPIATQTLSVTTVANGAAAVQNIEVDSLQNAQQQGLVVSPVRITSQAQGKGVYNFSAESLTGNGAATPLLYHWTFGDGQESLIMNPSHTFAADGTYTITLQVRNLVDGQDVANEQQQLSVVGVSGTVAGSSASSLSSSTAATTTTTKSGIPIMTILLGLGIFLFFCVLGVGVVFLLSRFRGGKSLDQTFAELEKNVVGKEGPKNPPPLVIPAKAIVTPIKSVATEEDVSKREENAASSPTPAATPRIDEKAAPDWLKKGLDTSAKTPTAPTPVAPVQAVAATPAAAKPTPAPVSVPTPAPVVTPAAAKPPVVFVAPTPSAETPTAPVPSWLKQPASTPTVTPTVPTPVVTPAVPPVSPKVVTAPVLPIPANPTPKPAVTLPRPPAPKPPSPMVPTPQIQAAVPAPIVQPVVAPIVPPKPASVPSPSTTSPVLPKPAGVQAPLPPRAPVSTPTPPVPPTPFIKPAVPSPVSPVIAPVAPSAPVTPVIPVAVTQVPAPVITPTIQKTPSNPPAVPVKPVLQATAQPSVQVPAPTAALYPVSVPQTPAAPVLKQPAVTAPLASSGPIVEQKPLAATPAALPVPPKTVEATKEEDSNDLPIAFIRADSLDAGNNKQS
jgi:PKD repeat protein